MAIGGSFLSGSYNTTSHFLHSRSFGGFSPFDFNHADLISPVVIFHIGHIRFHQQQPSAGGFFQISAASGIRHFCRIEPNAIVRDIDNNTRFTDAPSGTDAAVRIALIAVLERIANGFLKPQAKGEPIPPAVALARRLV